MSYPQTERTKKIVAYIKKNKGKKTYDQVCEHFKVKKSVVQNVVGRANLRGFLVHAHSNGKMEVDGSLKGEVKMEPTKADLSRLRAICEERGLPFENWGIFWDKTRSHSIAFYNKKAQEADEDARKDFLKRVTQTAPKNQKRPLPSKNLAVFASFDVHIGKHCELIRTGREYTPEKAIKQVLEGQSALYQMVQPHGITDILFPMGNDIVHVDNNKNTTTSGTPQDNYGSVESQILMAAELYIKAIEEWSKTHNVWLCHTHSNHDRLTGWMVSQIVSAYFRNNKRVHTSVEGMSQQHRKYFVFGNSLIMFHHGEAKEEKLLGAIKAEANNGFWQSERIYCYQGHTHHKTVSKRGMNTEQGLEKDHNALTVIKAGQGAKNQLHVETVRSPSPSDAWHSEKLYLNMPSIEVFLHNERHQFGRFTHEF